MAKKRTQGDLETRKYDTTEQAKHMDVGHGGASGTPLEHEDEDCFHLPFFCFDYANNSYEEIV